MTTIMTIDDARGQEHRVCGDEGAGTSPIQLTKEFFIKQTFRNTEDLALFHLLMFQRREL
jgi:hypothetical protein